MSSRYDLSHWPALPVVSCQCITYGRTSLLDEAVESFLRQDYAGEKELVILNDYPELRIECEIPSVRVINLPCRMKTIGEKRNACTAMCRGSVIFPWDDDDIHLPHRISYSLQQMKNRRYYKSDKFWYWAHGAIASEPKPAVAHAMGCWSVEPFDEVGVTHICKAVRTWRWKNCSKGAGGRSSRPRASRSTTSTASRVRGAITFRRAATAGGITRSKTPFAGAASAASTSFALTGRTTTRPQLRI